MLSEARVSSRSEPRRPERTASSARKRDIREMPASAHAASQPRPTSSSAPIRKLVLSPLTAGRPSVDGRRGRQAGQAAAGPPVVQDPLLEGEHLALLVGLLVVVAEHVQHPVDGEQLQLLVHRVLGGGGQALLLRHLGAEHDVAEQALRQVLALLARTQLVHGEGHHVGRSWQVHPLDVQLRHRLAVVEDHGELGLRMDPHLVEGVAGDVEDGLLVDVPPGLVGDVDRHGGLSTQLSVRWDCRGARAPRRWTGLRSPDSSASCRASQRSYASTMRPTSLCRTTSVLVSTEKWMSGTSARISWTTLRPERVPPGRSIWLVSPVTTTRELKPRRVRNIFICSGEVFCASSRMMKASFRVRPRMYASGATSIVPAAISRGIDSGSIMSCRAS